MGPTPQAPSLTSPLDLLKLSPSLAPRPSPLKPALLTALSITRAVLARAPFTFQYTVQAGDTSNDLDYVATNSLTAGTSIKDSATNDANLTLVAPGAVGSIANGKAIVIDATTPTVTAVTSTEGDGTYPVGTVIDITVGFTKNVTVVGTPTITLETGTTDRVVDYASGSGTSTLTFQYTVQAGDNILFLDTGLRRYDSILFVISPPLVGGD